MLSPCIVLALCIELQSSCSAEKPDHHMSAITMQGGGFRAFTADMGFFAGILAFVREQNRTASPTMSNSGLLKGFDMISTNSGSSWFFASLVYSKVFGGLLHRIAESPGDAASLFDEYWFKPWLVATGVQQSVFEPLRDLAMDIVSKLLGKADEDTIFTMQYFLSTKCSWNFFTEVLLESTASIGRLETLASPVEEWVRNKTWLIVHSLMLPTGSNEARLYQARGFSALPRASYVAQSSSSIPLFAPAKFSFTLGSANISPAPLPYIAEGSLQSLQTFLYRGLVNESDQYNATTRLLDRSDLSGGVLIRDAGRLPLSRIASASSAFAGSFAVMGPLIDEFQALAKADMTPWVSMWPHGASFAAADWLVDRLHSEDGINQFSIDLVAGTAVHGVIDGGYSDGTGIGSAIGSGASELLVILNGKAIDGEFDPFYIEVLCKDGPEPTEPGTRKEVFTLFETASSTVKAEFSKFHKLGIPAESRFLRMVSVGTLVATTVDNRFFGISGGRSITMNIISFGSLLNIGFFAEYSNYNSFLQEVVQTIIARENEAFVGKVLLPMVVGRRNMQAMGADASGVVV